MKNVTTVVIDDEKSERFQTIRGVRWGNVSSIMLFSIIMDKIIIRTAEEMYNGTLKSMVCTDENIIGTEWKNSSK
jgi:hypothetical protein